MEVESPLSMMDDVPEDVLAKIACNLSAPDVLSFLSTNRRHYNMGVSKNNAFWNIMLQNDDDDDDGGMEAIKNARQTYMIRAYKDHLPAVKWYPIRPGPRATSSYVSAREGHLACVFNMGAAGGSKICITGGFTDDNSVFVLNVPPSAQASSSSSPHPSSSPWTWDRLYPIGSRTSFVYGASLTALERDGANNHPNQMRAIRFGGFRSGGYTQETNEVAILTMKEETTNNDTNDNANAQIRSAVWETIPTQNSQYADPRAYHTATLIGGRYLLVIGGMTWRESIIKESILDTQTMTWFDVPITTSNNNNNNNNNNNDDEKPSGRHGHSIIFDSKRNRLVLFGGGSGTDLLRSGRDNSEVWELKLSSGWETNIKSSLPWAWNKIHKDTFPNSNDDWPQEEEEDNNTSSNEGQDNRPEHISPRDALCLGRCHNSFKVSSDKVLLLFGSGRPSTNGVISFDLRTDTFSNPTVGGPMPTPRFTGIVAMLQDEGYLFAHGGYSSQQSDSLDDMTVLDLAPALNREFTGLTVDTNFRCFGEVSHDDAIRGRQNSEAMLQRMLFSLSNADEEERQTMAAQMLGRMIASGQVGGRSFMLMNMIANGAAILRSGDDDDDDSESDDNE